MTDDIKWGPSGETVYRRTYSRKLPDGSNETWPETVGRVVKGNLALVHGDDMDSWPAGTFAEFNELYEHIIDFKILPAGRHLWASGVKGRQYLMNCWTSGWGDKLSDHMEFTFMRLMEGGGVGANYSSDYLKPFGLPRRALRVHVVADTEHQDYTKMRDAGLLSEEYDADWDGAFEVEDSREGWAAALVDLIDTFMSDDEVKHENRVYDVSRVRPEGARLKTFGGTASGPAPFARMMHEVAGVLNSAVFAAYPQRWITGIDPVDPPVLTHAMLMTLPDEGTQIYFPNAEVNDKGDGEFEIIPHLAPRTQLTPLEVMEIDHAIAECVVSGGVRRSARMAMVHWADPYIFDFIDCKADGGKHWTTNISIEIDDDFIADLDDPQSMASAVHRAAVEAMLTNGEPGYFNSSLANHGEVNKIYTTNPCGEITLEEWEACNLGHVNLDAFAPASQGDSIDHGALYRAHQLVTRFLIRATFADINDPKSRAVQDRNRRIGVGHFGVQGFLAKNGIRYSKAASLFNQQHGFPNFPSLLGDLKQVVRNEARKYAFELRIPEPIKTTTVAPTGSIAKLPGVTEGIHPIYARHFIRRIRFSKTDADQMEQLIQFHQDGFDVEDCIYDESGNTAVVSIPTKELLVEQVEALGYPGRIVESADEISLDAMLNFQAMYQKHYADNAVSFTVNFPEGEYTTEEASKIIAAYLPVLKGTTLMPDGTRAQAPYTRITEAEYESASVRSVEDSTDLDCATGACPIR